MRRCFTATGEHNERVLSGLRCMTSISAGWISMGLRGRLQRKKASECSNELTEPKCGQVVRRTVITKIGLTGTVLARFVIALSLYLARNWALSERLISRILNVGRSASFAVIITLVLYRQSMFWSLSCFAFLASPWAVGCPPLMASCYSPQFPFLRRRNLT